MNQLLAMIMLSAIAGTIVATLAIAATVGIAALYGRIKNGAFGYDKEALAGTTVWVFWISFTIAAAARFAYVFIWHR